MILNIAFKNYLVRFFILVLLTIPFIMNSLPAISTELPKPVVEYIKKNYHKANIRFDGLIELADGTVYIPVLPISYEGREKDIKVSMTIPEKVEKPDLIVFSNNLSLLKVIKNEKGDKTFMTGPSIPLKVKLGLLPQDLVVPEGLVIPSDLSSIIGDLVIPGPKSISAKNNTVSNSDSSDVKPVENPPVKPLELQDHANSIDTSMVATQKNLVGLTDKILYIINITGNKIYVFDPVEARIINTIQIGALPYKAVLSPDGKRLYVVCMSSNAVAVVNTSTSQVENMIKVGLRPVDIAMSPDGSKLYIANSGSGTVSVIDTNLFEVANNLEVQGMPEGVVASNDNVSFYMFNKASGIVSKWDSTNFQNRQFLFMTKNPTSMIIDPAETKVYVASRVINNLIGYSIADKKYTTSVTVGNKPVNLLLSADGKKIYSLDAGDDKISVVNTDNSEIISSIPINSGGFPTSINLIPGTNIAIVTNSESDQVTLVDLNAGSVITTMPVGIITKGIVFGPPRSSVER